MTQGKHTPGPWIAHSKSDNTILICNHENYGIGEVWNINDAPENHANARLIVAAPCQNKEMVRFLPVLECIEADPELWYRMTSGLGIATLNGYRAAIAKAKGENT